MYILIYINEYIKIVLYPVAEYLSWYWQTLWQEIFGSKWDVEDVVMHSSNSIYNIQPSFILE